MAIGVDTHRDLHVAVAVDQLGRRLGSLEVPVDERGFEGLLEFVCRFGAPAFVVEGTGSYGASLARFLLAAGYPVFECERPNRRTRKDKNDLIDAERAARRLLAGEPLARPRTGAARDRLRLLLLERRSAQHARRQAINQLQAAIVTLDPPLRTRLQGEQATRLARSRLLQRQPPLASLRRLAQRIVLLDRELAEIDRELELLTHELCPTLRAEHGVGPVCAAQLLVSAADPSRFRSEQSFAALAGVSPIEASSGTIKRHRLNRGGDRQLNWALHITALSRISSHPETKAYYDRLQHRGKTKREAIRIIKRALARRLYKTLTAAA